MSCPNCCSGVGKCSVGGTCSCPIGWGDVDCSGTCRVTTQMSVPQCVSGTSTVCNLPASFTFSPAAISLTGTCTLSEAISIIDNYLLSNELNGITCQPYIDFVCKVKLPIDIHKCQEILLAMSICQDSFAMSKFMSQCDIVM